MDSHNLEGSHWVTVYAYSNREVCYFDSLANDVNPIIHERFLKKFPSIIKNSKPYQTATSNNCAHHCICFIYFLSLGYSFDDYIKYIDGKPNPDSFVKYLVNKMIE
jgi:hypothetical protein